MKEALFSCIETYREDMLSLADAIFDHPELSLQETFASEILCSYLEQNGLRVERGVGGLDTAFRAEAGGEAGGPSIGLLAEYDALPGVNHACGHHMQGPVMIAAFLALKKTLSKSLPYRLVLYGTPGEEGAGGKVIMMENGCFRDIDVALMMHGGDMTTYDPTMSANARFTVTFHGDPYPGGGNPAFDAMLLAMNGVEFLREHMVDNARIHYAPILSGEAAFSTGQTDASGDFILRSLRDEYLDDLIRRFYRIVEGAAMITGIRYSIEPGTRLNACFPNPTLAEIFYRNAELAQALRITVPRGTMGSTDFGNVMRLVPGFCARVAFAPPGTGAHSLAWAEVGKSEEAHECVLTSAKLIAGMALDIIEDKKLLESIRRDHLAERDKSDA